MAKSFISYFSKNSAYEGFLFARDFHTDTYLEAQKQKAKQQRKENARKKKCDINCIPLSELEYSIGESLGSQITKTVEEYVFGQTECELDNINNKIILIFFLP